ncbi:MAG TPA: TonB-dependent receptor [Gemmatimonadales bacterium]|nr:TonB-dependent receptor [Gemmatimonadales bacterium]
MSSWRGRVTRLLPALMALSLGLAAQGTGVVSGSVTDSAGRPIADALITVTGARATVASDATGRFHLTDVPAGSPTVTVRLYGYRPDQRTIQLAAGDTVRLTVILQPLPFQLGAIQVTGTKHAQTQAEAMTTIALVSDTVLRQRAINTPDEAVNYAPAVQMIDGQVNIRGSSGFVNGLGSRVLLLVDGVPMNQADRGGINWDVLPVDEIDHVEIAKGAGSALYGSSAFGGVVNLITRDLAEGLHLRVRATGGNYANPPHDVWAFRDFTGYQEGVDASASYGTPSLRAALTAGGRHSDGYREQDVANHWQTAGKVQWRPDPVTHVDVSGSWASDQYDVYEPWCARDSTKVPLLDQCHDMQGQDYQPFRIVDNGDTLSSRGNFTRSDKGILAAVINRRPSEQLSWLARLSAFRTHFTDEYPLRPIQNPKFSSADVSISTGYGAEGRVVAHPDEHRTVTVGVEGSFDTDWSNIFSGDTTTATTGTHNQGEYAAYAEGEQAFGKLRMTIGVRADFISVDAGAISSVVSPRVGLVLLDHRGSWRASAGRAFRAPSLAERFVTTYFDGIRVIPNPDLTSETAWSFEAGRLFIPSGRLQVDVAGFWTEAKDAIEPVLGFLTNQIQFQNIQNARLAGVDVAVTALPLTTHLTTTVSYMYLYTQDLAIHQPLPFRPEHLAVISADYTWRGFGIGGDFRYSSRFERVELHETDPRVGQQTVDLRASWGQGPWGIHLKLGNTFNYIYNLAPRILEPGRTATLVLTWTR